MPFEFAQVRGRLLNRPLLITPEKAADLLGVLAPRAGMTGRLVWGDEARPLSELVPAGNPGGRATGSLAVADRTDRKAYPVRDGIAVVSVQGTLVAKLGTLDPWSGMTGYDGIVAKIAGAAADPEIDGILLDVESPGGEVHSSLQEAAEAIRAARAVKPVWAVCSDFAYSAAYWLASQAERIVVPPTGGVGSVGVVCLHADYSRALDDAGITVTLIHAGAHKVDGNPYEPLPDEVRERIQAEIEDIRAMFALAVAEGRGLEVDDVLATEARCLTAEEAMDIGFADEVLTPEAALAHLVEEIAGDGLPLVAASAAIGTAIKEDAMAQKTTPAAARAATRQDSKEPDDPMPGEEDGKRSEEAEAPEDDGKAEGDAGEDAGGDEEETANAASSERGRIAAILEAPEAKGREALARHLALHTDMAAKDACAALAAAPKGGGLAEAMAAETPATVGDGIVPRAQGDGWDRAIAKVSGRSH